MPLQPEEIKRRIEAARIIRGMSQKDFDRRGAAEGYGKGEMARVERGEIPYRAGKHLDVLCRILDVPRWWFTVDKLSFGGIDSPTPVDEVASILAQQTSLLHEIRQAVTEEKTIRDEIAEQIRRLGRDVVEGDPPAREPDRERVPRRPDAAES